MKNKKPIYLILAAALLIPITSAELALTVPENSKEIKGLEAEYSIGLINTGDRARNITFEASSPEAVELDIPAQVRLEPSETTSSPSGSNWYQASTGTYVEIQYVGFNASIDPEKASQRRYNFSVSTSITSSTERFRPKVSSVNQLEFFLSTSSDEIDTGFNGELFQEHGEEGDSRVEEQDSDNSTESESEDIEDQESGNSSSRGPASSDEPSDSRGLTIILLAGILLCVGYILSEVFV